MTILIHFKIILVIFRFCLYQEIPLLKEGEHNIYGNDISYILKDLRTIFVFLFCDIQKLRFVLHWLYCIYKTAYKVEAEFCIFSFSFFPIYWFLMSLQSSQTRRPSCCQEALWESLANSKLYLSVWNSFRSTAILDCALAIFLPVWVS